MSHILDKIVAHKRSEVESLPPAAAVPPKTAGRGFALKVRTHPVRPAVIAEIKRASPSKGPIAPDIDPQSVAAEYLKSGAAALSILTDSEFFKGSLADLRSVRAAFPDAPILRKDFIIDPRQVDETAGGGADAILLILACLDDELLRGLAVRSWQAGLDILFEVHDENEVARLLPVLNLAPADDRALFGINNRDLRTFEVDLGTTGRCVARLRAAGVGARVIAVAESGIRSREDITALESAGAGAFLIGESLIRGGSPGGQLAKLLHTV